MDIHPKEITGSWDQGYVLDVHTISSTMIGSNEFGHPEFDTVRSELGELVYRLKYKGDKTVIPFIVQAIVGFVHQWHPTGNSDSRAAVEVAAGFPARNRDCKGTR